MRDPRILLHKILLPLTLALCLCSCGKESARPAAVLSTAAPEGVKEPSSYTMDFVDVLGRHHSFEIDGKAAPNRYLRGGFLHDNERRSYADTENYDTRLGVDVSRYQGDEIDWAAVKAAGYDFAFLRIGFRGYGESGSLNADSTFEVNYKNARAAGVDLGVYFFSQAVDEAEAVEEADFVLSLLSGRELYLPVVFDPESITGANARTDNVSGEQFTKNTRAFCERIREKGYTAGVYCNMLWEAYQLKLSELSDIPVWYADYEPQPQTPYHFAFWQYTESGRVPGIPGKVDLNLWLIPKKQ